MSHVSGRQRAMEAEGHLVMVLHQVPKADEADRRAGYFWRKPTGEWVSDARGPALARLKELIEGYNEAQLALDAAHDKAETATDWHAILARVIPLKRASRNLYETLQSARKAIPEISGVA